MKRWIVRAATAPLKGAVRVQGDKSIGHRALILGSIATGVSRIQGLSRGEDNAATRRAFERMGVRIEAQEDGALLVHGVGLDGLRAADGPIDCGNSGTTMRLLAGLLAGQPFDSTLVGDASLSRRPMGRICRPLRSRGARIDGQFVADDNDERAPLSIRAMPKDVGLSELEYDSPVASAQVKSALLLSGLYASGSTMITEPVLSRDHTERMLEAMGAPIRTMGPAVVLDPHAWDHWLAPVDFVVPADPSSAVFVLVAGALVEGSRVGARGVCINRTRTGALDVLRDMGCAVLWSPKGEAGGEPIADLFVSEKSGALRSGARVGGETAVRAIDEVPALVAASASVRAVSEFRDLRELRVKESDRIEAMARVLRAFGREVEVLDDGLRFEGGELRPTWVSSEGDHRVAMAAALMALVARGAPAFGSVRGATVIEDTECVSTSFPGFVSVLRGLGADIVEEELS
jgi:3-phosphoshikimate 1-carboxyvinyltransferase